MVQRQSFWSFWGRRAAISEDDDTSPHDAVSPLQDSVSGRLVNHTQVLSEFWLFFTEKATKVRRSYASKWHSEKMGGRRRKSGEREGERGGREGEGGGREGGTSVV